MNNVTLLYGRTCTGVRRRNDDETRISVSPQIVAFLTFFVGLLLTYHTFMNSLFAILSSLFTRSFSLL